MRSRGVLLLALWAVLTSARGAAPEPSGIPAGFALDTVAAALRLPVSLAFTPDGRIFYSELHRGNVRIIQSDSLLPDPFYSFDIDSTGEKGLLGLTVDPAYPDSPFIYVFYTDDLLGRNRVVRLTDSLNTGVRLRAVLDSLPAAYNHNGGNMRFGPDGKLYVTVGDNLNTANSDDTTSLAGKILRFERDGSIPADNPFPGYAAYCLGLRNSFDLVFHPHNGELFATENGPTSYDELNLIRPGRHYGWPSQLGPGGEPVYTDPIHYYPSVIAPTGITVCRSTEWPIEYFNDVFFVDYNRRHVRRLILQEPSLTTVDTVMEDWLTDPGLDTGLLDAEFGPDGQLYFTDFDHIYRLRYVEDSTGIGKSVPTYRGVVLPNEPNPFNPSTTIPYSLEGPGEASVRVEIVDPSGRLVKALFEGRRGTGSFETQWDGTNESGRRVSSGVYLVRLTYGDSVDGRVIVLVE
jgi:glucose/arabinose dehydrogenase